MPRSKIVISNEVKLQSMMIQLVMRHSEGESIEEISKKSNINPEELRQLVTFYNEAHAFYLSNKNTTFETELNKLREENEKLKDDYTSLSTAMKQLLELK